VSCRRYSYLYCSFPKAAIAIQRRTLAHAHTYINNFKAGRSSNHAPYRGRLPRAPEHGNSKALSAHYQQRPLQPPTTAATAHNPPNDTPANIRNSNTAAYNPHLERITASERPAVDRILLSPRRFWGGGRRGGIDAGCQLVRR